MLSASLHSAQQQTHNLTNKKHFLVLTGINEVGVKIKTFIAKLHHIKAEEKQEY